MRFTRSLSLALIAFSVSALPASAAANKEHQQLMAEIRMLQEQQQQLQAMLGTLGDAVKAVSIKLDDQASAARKAMADQTLQMNGIGDNVRVLREKADDTNVRISSMAQEIEALRQLIASQQPPQTAVVPSPVPAPGTDPGVMTPPTPAPPSVNPGAPVGVSPQRMWEAAFSDYTGSNYDFAIEGFQAYIRAFPRSPDAAKAMYYIGQSYFNQNKWKEALDAYQRVISEYAQSDWIAPAYYKIGMTYERLNQLDLARKAFETVIKSYSTTQEAIFAKQALDRINRAKD